MVGVLRAVAAGGMCLLLTACGSTPDVPSAGPRPPSSTPSSSPPAATSSTHPPAGPVDAVSTALGKLDLRAEVAQLFVVGVPLDDLDAGASVVHSGVGGVFLAGRSAAPAAELAATTAHWQATAPGPHLWIAVDQEGGLVQTLQGPDFGRLPSAREQGALPADRLAELAGKMGADLHRAGINLDLAPVVDVVPAGTEKSNAPIGAFGRQYGATAAAVTAAARTVVGGLASAGVTATLKHFPGLGRVVGNTDSSSGVVDPVTGAGDEQVALFGAVGRSPAPPFVMASSATYPRIDPKNEAMFSSAVLTGLLRDRLGFDGVILSDDVGTAEAVQHVPPGQRAVRFLRAGGTMVLTVSSAEVPAMIDEVVATSLRDPAFAETVDAAVRTALEAKARAGLLSGS